MRFIVIFSTNTVLAEGYKVIVERTGMAGCLVTDDLAYVKDTLASLILVPETTDYQVLTGIPHPVGKTVVLLCEPGFQVKDQRVVCLDKSLSVPLFLDNMRKFLYDSDQPGPGDVPPEVLTRREKEILAMIGKGKTSREIADQLFISRHTVNSHRKNLLKKLKMSSPAQLIVYALENNL